MKFRMRSLAFLLSLALCVESAPAAVLAAQPEAELVTFSEEGPAGDTQERTESGEQQEIGGEQGTGEAQNPEEPGKPQEPGGSEEPGKGETAKPGEGDQQTPENGDSGGSVPENPGENGDSGENVPESPGGNGDFGENKPQTPGENGEPTEEETPDPGEDGEPQKPEENDKTEEEERGLGQVSGNDVDSVSDNDLSSVSENDLSSVSENSLDTEQEELIQRAKEAFDELLSEKSLMALLYHADSYEVRKEADEKSGRAATLEIGQTLYIQGVEITEDDIWYQTQYLLDGAEGTGYVQSYYLAYSDEDWLAWEEEYLFPILELGVETYEDTAYGMRSFSMMTYAVDTSDISAFPGSYQTALRSLKNAHPNWTFVPMKTGLDFNTSVSKEMGDKSLIQRTTDNVSKGWVGSACPSESGWYYATQPAVAYHMDPRNFLTETYIFQFEQLTYNPSYHTESAVQTFLNGTFMKGKLPDDSAGRTYAKAFYEIGKGRKLSPIHLASRVYQEQGQGTSGLISGTYPGYEGYYNFFNVGVNGSSTAEKIRKGLEYAKGKGWNTRYKSLEGGAGTIGNNYILKGQDTIYLEKFNVNKNSPYGVYNHQYMQNIQAPRSESSTTKKMYTNAGSLNNAFVFKIPVYNNMPGNGDTDGSPDEVYSPTLKLDKTGITMNKSADPANPATQQLKFYVDGVVSDPTIAQWKSSDAKVASVQGGLITAEGPGEAVITASYQTVEVSCKVTVKAPLQNISLDKETVTLRRPDTVVENTSHLSAQEKAENVSTAVLQVSFEPADTTADKTIVWTSANQRIATVKADPEDSSRAVVTAVGTGEVKITAKASRAGNKTAVCVVKVIAPIYRLELSDPGVAEGAGKTELFKGQSVSLNAEYWPKDTTSDNVITWTSSNAKVATVKDGRVTAQEAGTAKITASVPGYTSSYTVTVKVCTVTFHNENGTVRQTMTLGYGDSVGEAKMPKEQPFAGKIFRGWYTKAEGQGSVFTADQPVYAAQTHVYPHYQGIGTDKGFYVVPVGDQTYTGSAIKPKVHVYDGTVTPEGNLMGKNDTEAMELVEGRDYTLAYRYNVNVNAEGKARPVITVRGKGNYTGTEYVYFDIVPKSLTDHDITADDVVVAYSGRAIKSAPLVYRNGKRLAANRDYTLTYPWTGTGAYTKAGAYPIVITGKGGYTGQITIYEKITSDVLLSRVSVARIPNQTYSNDQMREEGGIRPASLAVTYKKQPLVEGEHYTLSYSNDQAVGRATVTMTAVEGSGYAGSRSLTYQIVGTPIARAKVEGLENKEYSGTEEDVRQSGYTLTLGDKTLTESRDGGKTGDYTVSYAGAAQSGAVKAGTATITFTGVNEYSGQLKRSYRILPYEFSSETIVSGQDITVSYYTQDEPEEVMPLTDLDGMTVPYVKGGSKPVVLLRFQGKELTPGKDYSISYRNNNAVTTAETPERRLPGFTVTGRGNFKGKLTGSFIITDGQFDKKTGDRQKITMTLNDVVYRENKGAYKTKVVLRDVSGAVLAAGRDYDRNLQYTYAEDTDILVLENRTKTEDERKQGEPVGDTDIPPAGASIRVTAQGIGAYAGTGDARPEISAVYRIVSTNFSGVRVKAAAKSYQDGRPVTLTADDLTITMNRVAEPLVLGKDYVIVEDSYINHTKKGTARVTLRGIGNYGGEKTISYTIGAKTLLWWVK